MSKQPSAEEIEHGITLLRDTKNWEGSVAVVAIDPVCRWRLDKDSPPCDAPVENAVVLLRKGGDSVEVVVFCEHHTNCMLAAVKKWREMA